MALRIPDSNGQLWEITMNTDGTPQVTAVSGSPSTPGVVSTQTVQGVVNYSRVHAELMPLADVAGFSNEPSLSIANDCMAEILAPPFAWKWNRVYASLLVPRQGRQELKFAGACAFVLGAPGGIGIDLTSNNGITESANTVTVKTLEDHNFTVGQTVYMVGNDNDSYNSVESLNANTSGWSGGWVITATPTARSFRFTHASSGLPTSGAAGIGDFGWLESATMVNELDNGAPRQVRELKSCRTLQPAGVVNIPSKIAVRNLSGGVLSVRFDFAPDATPWGVSMVYQAKAVPFASLGSTLDPIPDEFAFVFRQMFLAYAFRYVGSSRSDSEYQKAQVTIAKALGRDDAEESEEHVAPEQSFYVGGV
jgi:hypothetical protein